MQAKVAVERKYTVCERHNVDLTLFSVESNQLFCVSCVDADKVDATKLVSASEYSDAALKKWKVTINWVKYLTPEHQQKKREYGIKWRSAFKDELQAEIQALCLELYNNKNFLDGKDPFLGLIELVAFSKQEVDPFFTYTLADKIQDQNMNLKVIQKHLSVIKRWLKEPLPEKFAEIKKSVFDQFK